MSEIIEFIDPIGKHRVGSGQFIREAAFEITTTNLSIVLSADNETPDVWGYLTADDVKKFIGAELREVSSDVDKHSAWTGVDVGTDRGVLRFVAHDSPAARVLSVQSRRSPTKETT